MKIETISVKGENPDQTARICAMIVMICKMKAEEGLSPKEIMDLFNNDLEFKKREAKNIKISLSYIITTIILYFALLVLLMLITNQPFWSLCPLVLGGWFLLMAMRIRDRDSMRSAFLTARIELKEE